MTKRAWILLLAILPALPVLAQGTEDLMKKARDLEKRASALLDAGKRGEAFDLLARAAELRERAKIAGKGKPAKAGKKKAVTDMPKGATIHSWDEIYQGQLKRFDRAIKAGNMRAAQKVAIDIRSTMVGWAASIEKGAMQKRRTEQRVARLEKQVVELRKLIDGMGR